MVDFAGKVRENSEGVNGVIGFVGKQNILSQWREVWSTSICLSHNVQLSII